MLPVFAVAAASILAAGRPAFDPRQHKSEITGSPAEVLVLGTMHLSQLPKPPTAAMMEPLLERLARFRPDVITIEGVSGEECTLLHRFDAQHGGAFKKYCLDTAPVEKATGLTVAEATSEVERTFASWPPDPTAADRRHLAMLFLASGDRASAEVQWLRLPPAERHAGDGLTQERIDLIVRKGIPTNENYAVAAALAARLRLERVYPVDDHVADGPDAGPDYDKALKAAWNKGGVSAVHTQLNERSANLRTSADLLAFYRFLNAPETERATIAGDMGRAARDASPQHYGRQYLAWWESRNLHMAGNIRSAFGDRPGARVLVIVGATHKGYLDAYLDMMQDVHLVDAEQFLH